MPEKSKQIVIHVVGGMVVDVYSQEPTEYIIVDEDTEGCDSSEIKKLDYGDLGGEYMVVNYPTKVDVELVKHVAKSV